MLSPSDVRNILLVRLDLLGDVLFSLSAVEPLRRRFPGARITMLTLPYTAPLARLEPAVDRVIAVDTNRIRTLRSLLHPDTWRDYWRVYRELRRGRYDLAMSLSGAMASLWAYLSGAAGTVGYENEAYANLMTDPVPGGRFADRMHDVDYVRRLVSSAGAPSEAAPQRVRVPEGALRSAEALFARHGISCQDRVVVVHAGSTNGSAKRWPAPNWGAFARRITDQAGARVVLVGAASDQLIADEVLAASGGAAVSVVGETSVEELLGVIARADLVATGDSGPLHLAVALERPLVAAYGPTDPAIHGPYMPRAPVRLHRQDLACSPCYSMARSAECPLGDPICMRLVTVSQMTESALELLRAIPARK